MSESTGPQVTHDYINSGGIKICLTHNRVAGAGGECAETRPGAVFGGYTRDELSAAFDQVKNRENWKLPVDTYVPGDADRDCIAAAVAFYTGSLTSFRPARGGRVKVTAAGYYECIGS